jgi:hypothetical protein
MTRNAPPPAVAEMYALGERLAAILEAETAALKSGDPQAFQRHQDEKTRIMALYQRECAALKKDRSWAAALPASVRDRLAQSGARLQKALKDQSAALARRRHVTEGIVQAIAADVAKKRQGASPYARPQPGRVAGPRPAPSAAAITLNALV